MNDLAHDEWLDRAACRGDVKRDLWVSDKQSDQAEAKSFCRLACPVKNDCLEYAIREREEAGIWGAMSPSERRRLWKSLDSGKMPR